MVRIWLMAAAVAAVMTSAAAAQTVSSIGPSGPQQPRMDEPMMISSWSAVETEDLGLTAPRIVPIVPSSAGRSLPIYTEYFGPMATTTGPGSGSRGMLLDNGNSTGMLIPGQPPKLASTPE
jgi:hypothetical protein